MDRPEFFTERRNGDGSVRYYWRASARLAAALQGTPHRTVVRLPDDYAAACEECRGITARIKAAVNGGEPRKEKPVERPRVSQRRAAAAPTKGRIHAAVRLAMPLLLQWSEELGRPTLAQCVYVMIAENGWVKVGNAMKPMKRLERLSTNNPFSLSLVFCLRLPEGMAALVERRTHDRLAPFRLRGEWFEVNPLFAVCAVLDEIAGLVHAHA